VTEASLLEQRLDGLHRLMRSRLKVRGSDFRAVQERAGRLMPRHIRARARQLAAAVPLLSHPKLRLTLDHVALEEAAREVETYLNSIDLADRRKGYILGVLGSIAANLLLILAALIAFLIWRSPG
jgi:hypothetical protein